MKIATWNVNGIRARHEGLVRWLSQSRPDIVCLQETKTINEHFPDEELIELGYNIIKSGQKGFNGVAILSTLPFDKTDTQLTASPRFLEAVVSTRQGALRIVSVYAPNGNPAFYPDTKTHSEKFHEKIKWLKQLELWVQERLRLEEALVIAGDYNILPEEKDARSPQNRTNDAIFLPQARDSFRRLLGYGLRDAVRCVTNSSDIYTFWDYQNQAWRRNDGLRIDHILLSPEAADCLKSVSVIKNLRDDERPSDHAPVMIELSIEPAS